jgi:hypothetical protein
MKSWRVGRADVAGPAPRSWAVHTPPANGRKPLVVEFDAAVASSAESLIAIRAPDGTRLEGAASLGAFESMWQFVPKKAWAPGDYALMVSPDLEDVAGNQSCSPFENVQASHARCDGVALPFSVRAVRQ